VTVLGKSSRESNPHSENWQKNRDGMSVKMRIAGIGIGVAIEKT
jgi:hypothetical protein